MKNFLSNLVLRVLTPEATLQPRLRTRFEAPSVTFEPLASQSKDVTPVDESTQVIISKPPAHSHDETGVEERPSSREANFAKRLKSITKDRSAESDDNEETNAPHATIRSTTSSSATVEDRSGQEKALIRVLSGNASRPGEGERRSDVKAAAPRPSRLTESLEEPKSKPRFVLPRTLPRERTLVPRSSPVAPQRTEARSAGMKTAGTIHISIGRVEVRAMVQTTASPHRAAAKPAKPASMTLDDYLTRRARGGKP